MSCFGFGRHIFLSSAAGLACKVTLRKKKMLIKVLFKLERKERERGKKLINSVIDSIFGVLVK